MYRGSVQGDVEWYCRKAVDSGGPVLELGAGTGRITIPIAEAGITVTAVDLDTGMLDRLREKAAALSADAGARVSVQQGDMRTVSLSDQYALVIIPFRAFLHNVTRADQLATLRRAHAHLRPAGELALNVFHPSLEFMAANAGAHAGVWRWRSTRKLDDGRFVVFSDSSRYITVEQRLESMLRTEEFAPDGSLGRTNMMYLELAYLYPATSRGCSPNPGSTSCAYPEIFTGARSNATVTSSSSKHASVPNDCPLLRGLVRWPTC